MAAAHLVSPWIENHFLYSWLVDTEYFKLFILIVLQLVYFYFVSRYKLIHWLMIRNYCW